MNVASLRVAAPLVPDEGGELALTVGFVRLLLNLRPHARRLFGAILAKQWVADRGKARRGHVSQCQNLEEDRRKLPYRPVHRRILRHGNLLPPLFAELGVVAIGTGRGADDAFREELGVLGHCREVERAPKLRRAASGGGLEGRNLERFTTREAIRIAWLGNYARELGVEREAGVNVQLANVEVSEWIAVGAGVRRHDALGTLAGARAR